jgi:hypothetical protein
MSRTSYTLNNRNPDIIGRKIGDENVPDVNFIWEKPLHREFLTIKQNIPVILNTSTVQVSKPLQCDSNRALQVQEVDRSKFKLTKPPRSTTPPPHLASQQSKQKHDITTTKTSRQTNLSPKKLKADELAYHRGKIVSRKTLSAAQWLAEEKEKV